MSKALGGSQPEGQGEKSKFIVPWQRHGYEDLKIRAGLMISSWKRRTGTARSLHGLPNSPNRTDRSWLTTQQKGSMMIRTITGNCYKSPELIPFVLILGGYARYLSDKTV